MRTRFPRGAAWLACAFLAAAVPAHAERADRDKPVNFSSDDAGGVNYDTRTGSLKGNVVITQGTMTVRADRIDFKQNADNSISATVYGNPLSFRQKKDGSDEYYEAYAQRAVYDGQKELLELFDRALLKQGNDEIRSNYIAYNTATGAFKAEGRPDQPGSAAGPGARVRGTFEPRGEGLPGPGKGTPASKGAPAKSAPIAKDPAAKAAPADRAGAPKSDAKAPAPLTLTPDNALKQ
jgi:lipopolysaccharide export system protein LptA